MPSTGHCSSSFAGGTHLDASAFHRQGEGVRGGVKEESRTLSRIENIREKMERDGRGRKRI